MKFKYVGRSNSYCLELVAYGLEKKGEYLTNGQIVDVPDDLTVVIDALDAGGNFVRVNETSKPKKAKKEEKE